MLAAIQRGTECHPFVSQTPQPGQAEDLKSAAIGEDGTLPAHEPMQTPRALDDVGARPQIQMERVGQNHLGADLLDFFRGQPFHGGLRADRHEGRRAHDSTRGVQAAQARTGGRTGQHFKPKPVHAARSISFTTGTLSLKWNRIRRAWTNSRKTAREILTPSRPMTKTTARSS